MTDITKTDPDTGKKLPPKPSIFQRGNIGYPWVAGSAGHWGEYNITTRPSSSSTDKSVMASEHLNLDDGYKVIEKTQNGKSVTHELNAGHSYQYVSGGHSHNKDGHSDIASGGNENRNIGVDRGSATANNGYDGHGGKTTSGTGGDGSYHHDAGGKTYKASSGDVVSSHDGNIHESSNGDHVAIHTGNKYHAVNGQYGVNVQGSGNYDLQIDGGKCRVKSGSDILIESDSKITLKVGGSSIVLDTSTLQLLASAIKMAQGS